MEEKSANLPQTGGKTAPPTIAIISSAEPVFINLPKPSIAKGQIAGHIKALAKPNKAIKRTDA